MGTGIGRWSLEAFARAMREGVSRDGSHLFPAFPYDHYTKLSDDDVKALYAYFMTRPPVRATAPANYRQFEFTSLRQRVLSFLVDREHPRRPLAVVIFEDLHWIATGKVLLLVNYLNTRPDAGQMRAFHAEKKRIPKPEDSLAERSEFELPVPLSKLSDDSVVL